MNYSLFVNNEDNNIESPEESGRKATIEDLTMTESEIEEHSRENDQFRPRLFENDYFEYNAGAIFRGDSRKKFIEFLA